MTIQNYVLYIFFLTLLTVSAFFIMLCSVFLPVDNNNLNKMNYLYNTWNKGAILDIILTQEFCPQGYVPVNLYETEEINAGTVTNSNGKTYKVEKKLSESHFTYRGNLICVKRHNLPYFDRYDATCGSCGYGDMFGNHECSGSCSVRHVMIIDIDEPVPNAYQYQNFADGKKKMIFSKQSNLYDGVSFDVVDFRLSLGEICSHPLERSLDSTYSFELFKYKNGYNKCKSSIGGNRIHPHYDWIDRDYGVNVFLNSNKNKILLSDGNVLNDNSVYNQDKIDTEFPNYNLYVQRNPGVNSNCKDKFEGFSFWAESMKNQSLNDFIHVPIILFVIYFFYALINLLFKYNNCWGEKSVVFSTIAFVSFNIAAIICIWIYYAKSETGNYAYGLHHYFPLKNLIHKYDAVSCFDTYTADFIDFVGNHYSAYHIIYLFSAIIISTICGASFAFPIILCFLNGCYDTNIDLMDNN